MLNLRFMHRFFANDLFSNQGSEIGIGRGCPCKLGTWIYQKKHSPCIDLAELLLLGKASVVVDEKAEGRGSFLHPKAFLPKSDQ